MVQIWTRFHTKLSPTASIAIPSPIIQNHPEASHPPSSFVPVGSLPMDDTSETSCSTYVMTTGLLTLRLMSFKSIPGVVGLLVQVSRILSTLVLTMDRALLSDSWDMMPQSMKSCPNWWSTLSWIRWYHFQCRLRPLTAPKAKKKRRGLFGASVCFERFRVRRPKLRQLTCPVYAGVALFY